MIARAGLVPLLMLSLAVARSPGVEPPQPPVVFTGMCDASAAAAVDGRRFIVADDEDNILRVFSREGGEALSQLDVSEFLGNMGKKKPKEADLEAAAQVGDRVFWIASHGRNAKGKLAPERQRLFATRVQVTDGKVEIAAVGKPYHGLLNDLIASEALAAFTLKDAATLAPKAPGGLNIEGLASTPEGHLLIGFRSPVREGKSLVVPLLNPVEVIEGRKAQFGKAATIDLQGQGIRSIERVGSRYVIIAGSPGESTEPSRIFEWNGKDAEPRLVPGVTLRGLNPEGVAFHGGDGAGEFFVLSDDGTRDVEGMNCKDLKDPALKTFRGRTLRF